MKFFNFGTTGYGETFVNLDNVAMLEFSSGNKVDVYFISAAPGVRQGLIHQEFTGPQVQVLFQQLKAEQSSANP